VKFQCLQKWAKRGSKSSVQGTEGTSKVESELPEEISTTIANLAKQLDLSQIPVSKLTSVVEQSHLVTRDDLYQAYRSLALCATDNKIVVEGAGTPEVNGTYIQGGEVHEGTPIYHMEGMWEDRKVTFSIYLLDGESWYISIVPEGKEPGENTDIYFYICDHTSGDRGMIPFKGWRPIVNGQTPLPTCSMCFVTR